RDDALARQRPDRAARRRHGHAPGVDSGPGPQEPTTDSLRVEDGTRVRSPDVLRRGHRGELPSGRLLRGQDPQGRQARRSAGRAADEIRAGDQPQDRQGPRPHDPSLTAGPRRPNHRMIDRRRFLLTSLAGAIAAPLAVEAQPPKSARIAILSTGNPRSAAIYQAFEQRLRELGYIE